MPRISHRFSQLIRFLAVMLVVAIAADPASAILARQDATPTPAGTVAGELPALMETCDSIFGVVILDAEGNEVFTHNPDLPFVSASLYKLVLITQIAHWAEEGQISLTDTVTILPEFFVAENGEDSYFTYDSVGFQAPIEELLYATGSYSSNVSAMALLSLTSIDLLNEFAQEIGLENTRYWLTSGEAAELYADAEETAADGDFSRAIAFVDSFAGSSTVNVTTPRDMSIFFRNVSTETLVSPLVSWRVRQVLTPRVINDRLSALLPADTPVIHKTGNLYGVLHDAGFIETPAGPIVVAAMAQAVTSLDQTFSVEQHLGLFAWSLGGGTPGGATPVASPSAAGSATRPGLVPGSSLNS